MNSQAASLINADISLADMTRLAPVQKIPFLGALAQADCGRLTLTAPDGLVHVFEGKKEGPVADWRVFDWGVFDDFVGRGELGFADAYIAGRWESSNIMALVAYGLANADQLEKFFHGHPFYALWQRVKAFFLRNTVSGSRRNVVAHYDLGNEFYKLWLDPSMTYSCGLFEGDTGKALEKAQADKYARILKKLGARAGDHILEIGCGWGGFAEAAARQGIRVTAITLAETQAAYAIERLKKAGLSHFASVRLIDYRKVEGTFDHVVSIGMFEHVGEQFWRTYFDTVRARLKPGGKAMIQSITLDDEIFERLHNVTGFIEVYIFPGGMLPSKRRFRENAVAAGLDCKEVFAFGGDYAITLSRWKERFEANLEAVRALGYDEKFIRLWRLYLASCIASFATRRSDVMQVELTHAAADKLQPQEPVVSEIPVRLAA